MSTKTLNRFLAAGIIASLAFSLFIIAVFAMPATSTTPKVVEVIEEDDPRWDCATMGNKVCGPTQEEVARFAAANCPIGFIATAAPEYA